MEMNGDSMDRGKWDACAVNSSRRWGQHLLSNVDHSPLIDHGEKRADFFPSKCQGAGSVMGRIGSVRG